MTAAVEARLELGGTGVVCVTAEVVRARLVVGRAGDVCEAPWLAAVDRRLGWPALVCADDTSALATTVVELAAVRVRAGSVPVTTWATGAVTVETACTTGAVTVETTRETGAATVATTRLAGAVTVETTWVADVVAAVVALTALLAAATGFATVADAGRLFATAFTVLATGATGLAAGAAFTAFTVLASGAAGVALLTGAVGGARAGAFAIELAVAVTWANAPVPVALA
jgi:hypothetical protein